MRNVVAWLVGRFPDVIMKIEAIVSEDCSTDGQAIRGATNALVSR